MEEDTGKVVQRERFSLCPSRFGQVQSDGLTIVPSVLSS